jgi:hypothetical protein
MNDSRKHFPLPRRRKLGEGGKACLVRGRGSKLGDEVKQQAG